MSHGMAAENASQGRRGRMVKEQVGVHHLSVGHHRIRVTYHLRMRRRAGAKKTEWDRQMLSTKLCSSAITVEKVYVEVQGKKRTP